MAALGMMALALVLAPGAVGRDMYRCFLSISLPARIITNPAIGQYSDDPTFHFPGLDRCEEL